MGLLVLQIGLMRLRGSCYAVHIDVDLELLAVLPASLLGVTLGSTPFPLEFVSLSLFLPRRLVLVIAFIRGVPFR